jgi:hypothetical protein
MRKRRLYSQWLHLLVSPGVNRRRVKVIARKGARKENPSSTIFLSLEDRVG